MPIAPGGERPHLPGPHQGDASERDFALGGYLRTAHAERAADLFVNTQKLLGIDLYRVSVHG